MTVRQGGVCVACVCVCMRGAFPVNPDKDTPLPSHVSVKMCIADQLNPSTRPAVFFELPCVRGPAVPRREGQID